MKLRPLFNYVKYQHNLYYDNIYYVGKENIPSTGTPLIIAGSHQNAINDPLAVEFTFSDREIKIFANSNLFKSNIGSKFFRSIGLLPAFRLKNDGAESLSKNYDVFVEAENHLIQGGAVAIFPEATNQDRHWLGDFSLAYLRMAFSAAEKCNFEKDIKILPISIHYSDYIEYKSDILIAIAEPISIEPYYELYKTKPRTAQRQINEEVRKRIRQMMLDITDSENYDAIDFLRNNFFTKHNDAITSFSPIRKHQAKEEILPFVLRDHQTLVHKLDDIKSTNNEIYTEICNDIRNYKYELNSNNIKDWILQKKNKSTYLIIDIFMLICLSPIFILTTIPSIFSILLPLPITNKFKSMGGPFVLFSGGCNFIIHSILTAPLCAIIVLVLGLYLKINTILVVIYSILILFSNYDFFHRYIKIFKELIQLVKVLCLKKEIKDEILKKRSILVQKLKDFNIFARY